ncbi:SPOR domain-containing protein [Sphingobium sp. DEHP117]|uniref:SPOR domain-containing protein n=1 Tax=Sphingobium sp. DEHP117 TaxID=2993436 RepID=UPI0027D6912B|nr:SPOR domain-containing protein [Sphingobium sp. DEHP117]MDQ4420818.1 SPOR domain-containing protein [Sphingobium sp. DEHP117]
MRHRICGALAGIALLAAAPSAQADTKAGVDAWAQGDYARAMKVWLPLAEAGDADAQFNLGQAYKMGRGVPQDPNTALEWYRKAAAQGHSQAEDAYGLLLYQQNRRAEAMPSLLRSADRGEARAQYLVGIALFNGDLLPRDWMRAYALMTRASASGVEQASAALAQMDRYIPEHQRRDGLALAAAMEARKARAAGAAVAASSPSAPQPILRPAPSTKPIRSATLPPSQPAPSPVSAPSQAPASAPAPAAKPAPVSGGWQVQLGAFGETARAQAQWKTLTAKIPALAAAPHRLEPAGAMTRLLAGSLTTRAEADALCGKVKAAGADCIVKPR